MSHAELDGAMLLNTVPGKSYEYFGYVRVAGIGTLRLQGLAQRNDHPGKIGECDEGSETRRR